jgi:hypothetical protein
MLGEAWLRIAAIYAAYVELLGWMTGFEPATSGSTIRRSNQLSYTHHEGETPTEL